MTMADFVLLSEMQDLKVLKINREDYPRHGGPEQILGWLTMYQFYFDKNLWLCKAESN